MSGRRFHRTRDEQRTEVASIDGTHGFCEEDPDMRALSRARTLEGRSDLVSAAGVHERASIDLPRLFVEIDREKPTRLVRQQRIDAGDVLGARAAFGVNLDPCPADDNE